MKKLHRVLTVTILCVLLCFTALPVAATVQTNTGTATQDTETDQTVQTGASQEIYEAVDVDSFTGETVASASTNLVSISGYCSYDKVQDVFIYDTGFATGAVFSASVPYGAVVQTAVTLDIPDNLSATLYRNGEKINEPQFAAITATGAYSLTMTEDDTEQKMLSFTILGGYVGDMYELQIPDGFRVFDVECSAAAIAYADDSIPLQQEGEYTVVYGSDAMDKRFQVEFTVDHTPPKLTFDGVTDGVAKGPVTVMGIQEGDTVSIYIDRTKAAFSTTLSAAGDYVVFVTDSAGNSAEYSFTIYTYFTRVTWIFFGLVVGLLAFGTGYIIFKRKKFRSN